MDDRQKNNDTVRASGTWFAGDSVLMAALSAHDCWVGKYSEVSAQLRIRSGPSWSPSFEERADLVRGGLPPSVYQHIAWWSNTSSHVQAQAGLSAGWRTQDVDLRTRRVAFVRS